VPAVLEGILVRALAAEPARRPTSAGELADALDATGLGTNCPPLRMDPGAESISETDETIDATGETAGDDGKTRADAPAARDRRARP
jgi:hypothetical protein